MRDLVRARETLRLDLMRARHRLSKLLLRHGVQFDDGRAWTERHRAWLQTVDLGWPAAQVTLLDAQGSIEALCHRREHLEREIVAILPSSPWSREVGRLRCLRGVDTLTAVGLCAEIGDFERFARAEQLMSCSQRNSVAASPATSCMSRTRTSFTRGRPCGSPSAVSCASIRSHPDQVTRLETLV